MCIGAEAKDVFFAEHRQLTRRGTTVKMNSKVQVTGCWYGMAFDVPGINYPWPRPVVLSRVQYAQAYAVLDGRQCALERKARLDEKHPHSVSKRTTFESGTLYSKFVVVSLVSTGFGILVCDLLRFLG